MIPAHDRRWESKDNLVNTSSVGLAYYIRPSTDDETMFTDIEIKGGVNSTSERVRVSSFTLNIDEDIDAVPADSKEIILENIEYIDDNERTITKEEVFTLRRRLRRLKAVRNLSGMIELPAGVNIEEVISYMKGEIE